MIYITYVNISSLCLPVIMFKAIDQPASCEIEPLSSFWMRKMFDLVKFTIRQVKRTERIRRVKIQSESGIGHLTKEGKMSTTKSAVDARSWSPKNWCVASLKKIILIGDIRFLICQCILKVFHDYKWWWDQGKSLQLFRSQAAKL